MRCGSWGKRRRVERKNREEDWSGAEKGEKEENIRGKGEISLFQHVLTEVYYDAFSHTPKLSVKSQSGPFVTLLLVSNRSSGRNISPSL